MAGLGQYMGQRMEMKSKAHGKKILRSLTLALSVVVLFAVCLFFLLPWLLIRPSEEVKSDVIFYFGMSDKGATDLYVAELYRQGFGKQIVCLSGQITWQTYPGDFARDRLLRLGLPAADVMTFHLPRTACEAELAPVLLAYLKQQGWKRVLMVTNPPASRATHRVLSARLAPEQITLAVTYAPVDRDELRGSWWRDHRNTQKLVGTGIEVLADLFYPSCW